MNQLCELQIPGVCGSWPPVAKHHRKLRKHGGTDDPVNLIDACGPCHSHVHLHPKESYEKGWLVKFAFDPADITWTKPTGENR